MMKNTFYQAASNQIDFYPVKMHSKTKKVNMI